MIGISEDCDRAVEAFSFMTFPSICVPLSRRQATCMAHRIRSQERCRKLCVCVSVYERARRPKLRALTRTNPHTHSFSPPPLSLLLISPPLSVPLFPPTLPLPAGCPALRSCSLPKHMPEPQASWQHHSRRISVDPMRNMRVHAPRPSQWGHIGVDMCKVSAGWGAGHVDTKPWTYPLNGILRHSHSSSLTQ